MSSASPPTARVVAVLELLASSREPLGTSAIARSLDLHKSTCHAILGALCETGLVTRSEPDKTYALGAGLIRLGEAARSAMPVLREAHALLETLSSSTGYGAWLSARDGAWLHTLEAVADTRAIPVQPTRGRRHPFGPPFGATLAAFSNADAQAVWLERAGAEPESPELVRLRRMLSQLRSTGVGIWRLDVPFKQVTSRMKLALGWLREEARAQAIDANLASYFVNMGDRTYTLSALDKPGRGSVSTMAAPVLDASGSPAYELGLAVFEDSLSYAAIKRAALALRGGADTLSRQIGGPGLPARRRRA